MSVDTLEEIAPLQEKQAYVFTGFDRCDSSQVEQAYHRWTRPGGQEMLFCNHHNNAFAPTLVADGWEVESSPQHDQLDKPLDINHIEE